jgi:hypothetical protein
VWKGPNLRRKALINYTSQLYDEGIAKVQTKKYKEQDFATLPYLMVMRDRERRLTVPKTCIKY